MANTTTDLEAKVIQWGANRRERPLAPLPERKEIKFPLVSADDHLLEPPDLFVGRLPERFADVAPRVVEDAATGLEFWEFDDERVPILGTNGACTWAPADRMLGPVRYDELGSFCSDPMARLAAMDVVGITASLCFPSMVFGFAGTRFMKFGDPQFGLAAMRAYNDWVLEEWCAPSGGRLIPQQVPWLLDPEIAAEEIRANAARGFTAVTFPEAPERLDLPDLYGGHWDPFLAACEETETVVNLHVGSAAHTFAPSSKAPAEAIALMFPLNAMSATADWLYSGVPVRFPGLRITLSESGIAWVPLLLDRLEYVEHHLFHQGNDGGLGWSWPGTDITPTEVIRRNFWFTTFFDPTAYQVIDRIGDDRVMIEVDFPHPDTTWPDTQELLERQFAPLDDGAIRRITHGNAVDLYRVPISAIDQHGSTQGKVS